MRKSFLVALLAAMSAAVSGCRSSEPWGSGLEGPFHPGPSLFDRTYFLRDDQKRAVPPELQNVEPGYAGRRPCVSLSPEAMDSMVVFGISYLFDWHRDCGLPPSDCDFFVGIRDVLVESGFSPPSMAALNALKVSGFAVRSCADARFPKDEERDPRDSRRWRGVENAETGRCARIVFVQVLAVYEDMAIIKAGHYGGLLDGGGEELLIQRVGGGWKIHTRLGCWVS